jgi:hypothetical protein
MKMHYSAMIGLVVVSALLVEWAPAQDKPTPTWEESTKPNPTREESIAAIEEMGGSFKNDGKWLYLFGPKVTDADLAHLKGMPGLEVLLVGPGITDAGLVVHLEGLTGLGKLTLSHSKATDAGLAKLKEALPKCTITR